MVKVYAGLEKISLVGLKLFITYLELVLRCCILPQLFSNGMSKKTKIMEFGKSSKKAQIQILVVY